MQRSSVGSALACYRAGPSSNLGSGIFPSELRRNEENGERPRRMKVDECIVLYERD